MLTQSFELMLYGLTGVFFALGILYVITLAMAKLMPAKAPEDSEES
ncbi:MAG: hypothetical protein FWE76_01730 [Symbiobacteriaceae bacterium]|nr:hypothetical protein [Symbiobacteriaceae bacterium]